MTTKKAPKNLTISFSLPNGFFDRVSGLFEKHSEKIVLILLSIISIVSFINYYNNRLGIAYNDARSHLDIGRRVVEGLKPGIAQLGTVWLPLPHILMTPTIGNDFMWHSGLAGALVSMISFVMTGLIIYKFLKNIGVGIFGRYLGVIVFVANINVLYLQSTAMTELLLIATMTAASYELLIWAKEKSNLYLIRSAFWIMLATLTRYDGWFLLFWATLIIILVIFRKKGYQETEGSFILFGTLAGFGIFLWLLWNLLIFKDPFYFAFGPYSAKAQQDQLANAGVLQTKYNLWYSIKFYAYALIYNSGALQVFLGLLGSLKLWMDKKINLDIKIAISALFAPLFFNVIALYFGHSVLFIQGLSGDTWFNVRYGIMLAPSIAIFMGYLIDKSKDLKWLYVGLFVLVTVFAFISKDAVTIDDARVGSSQKNVSEVSGWLREHAGDKKGFVLISAASHDAIIFSSGLPMKRFIHEGTGLYWENATALPDRWARWIIMRTYDDNDSTYRLVKNSEGFKLYNLVNSFPFADIYELKPEYIDKLNLDPILQPQR